MACIQDGPQLLHARPNRGSSKLRIAPAADQLADDVLRTQAHLQRPPNEGREVVECEDGLARLAEKQIATGENFEPSAWRFSP
jgi:hypothetical protein